MSQSHNHDTRHPQENLICLVLCGGQSKRMGKDKGLLLKNDKAWSQIVTQEVKKLNIPVSISINPSQKDSYNALFTEKELIVDSVGVAGPLTGLLSAHKAFPDKDILLVACDMIDMEAKVLRLVVETYRRINSYEFYSFAEDEYFEPLSSIYTAKALHKIYTNLENKKLNSFSLSDLLKRGNTYKVNTQNKSSFKNYNYPI